MLTFVTSPDPAWDPESGLPAADAICAAVRQRIISGHYTRGQRITEEQVATDFKASRMSVREALRMLNAEGFLVIRPYFGTHVATMTRRQVSDLLELQGGLEAMAAGFAARRRSLAAPGICSRWSRMPCHNTGRTGGSEQISRQACFNVHREAARLPLSTVETNNGSSGCRVSVSYQLKRWPA